MMSAGTSAWDRAWVKQTGQVCAQHAPGRQSGPVRFSYVCVVWAVLSCPVIVVGDQPESFGTLATEYERNVRPLLKRFCLECHSSEQKEGELDLERFAALDEVRRGTKVWLKVVEMLAGGEMPPKDSAQPSRRQRKVLREWVERYLHAEALASAGDPGPVILRRLTNAEYTWTIRDLTGVDLNPSRDFPSEGAAGEGFTNTGNALVMSPGLLRKYLDSGKQIAAHAVLLPDGFRLSPYTTRRDRTDEMIAKIRAIYAEFSEVQRLESHYGHGKAHLGTAGRLPLEKYFAATLALRDSTRAGARTVEAVAAERGLNAKYLSILFSKLTGDDRSPLVQHLRTRWRSAKPQDAGALADHVATWQKGLWIFNPVGLLGRKGSRSRWLEPVNPVLTQQEFRFSLPVPEDGAQAEEFLVSLVVTDAGDGNEHDVVLWKQPRLIAEGKPDILLRDVSEPDAPAKDSAEAPEPDDAQAKDSSRVVPSLALQASMFGKHPNGKAIDAASLCVRAPSVISIRLPADLAGRELVTTAALDPETGREGSVQPDVVAGIANAKSGLQPSEITVTYSDVDIGADKRTVSWRRPILVSEKNEVRERFESAIDAYRSVFPAALCYTQIVPVDEILTLTLFYREDDHLVRLMLDGARKAQLDTLWDELRYVSREPIRLVDVLDSLLETTIDHPQSGIFDSLVEPFNQRADAFRAMLIQTETKHLDALVAFTARAWRRPLAEGEQEALRGLYRRLREVELPHEAAFRLTLARALVALPFLYRLEEPPAGTSAVPVSDWELASRLSYFLWSSMPDDELRAAAKSGRLTRSRRRGGVASDNQETPASGNGRTEDDLLRQTRRMLKDARVRRLATEFACQWLHIHEFASRETKSEKHFPEFAHLRGDMYEESILLFTDLFRSDGSLLSLLDADHTFVNERLATFYGIPGVEVGTWQRVDAVRQRGRGGILGLAATLAKQSGATRTSPILRGNWVSEVLLGEKLPRPPKNVPQLADTVPEGLTERQLIERHSSDAACANCHLRIDPYGFALEGFDAIGRRREKNAGGLAIDSRTTLPDGTEIQGLSGLRDYLLEKRRDAFLRQFCRKLLGYAIGRELQLSDEPLLDKMITRLAENDYRFSVAVETIVLSKQFRMIRGRSYNP